MYADKTAIQIFVQIVFALFFIVLGIKNLIAWPATLGRMRDFRVPFPAQSLAFGFVMQFTGALLVLFDVYTPVGVAILIAFTMVATWIFHRFWLVKGNPFRVEFDFLIVVYNVFVIAALILIL